MMRKLKNNEKGFGAVEAILIVIIVLLIGAVGYLVYKDKHKAPVKTVVVTKTVTVSPKASSSTNYFSIPEWSVRAPYSGNLSLHYTLSTSSGEAYAKFTSDQLDATSAQCRSAATYGGVILRFAANDTVYTPDGTNTGKTATQYFTSGNTFVTYIKVGNYYYQFSQPQGVCDASQVSQDAQQATVNAVRNITENLQAINK
jgi:hypothetical protein